MLYIRITHSNCETALRNLRKYPNRLFNHRASVVAPKRQ